MSAPWAVPVSDPGAGSGPEDEGNSLDGRHIRRDRNRQAVVDALLDLYGEGNLRPSSSEVAERAGLSPRSVFRYFEDVDDLSRSALGRQLERALPLVPIAAVPGAPLSERIAALVAQRLRLFEAIAPAATVSRLRSPFQPVLATQLRNTRSYLRHQIAKLFAGELGAMGQDRAASVLAAADVLCSFESYQLLIGDQDLGAEAMTAVLVASLTALLDGEQSPV